jgi:uncharacterized membrane protein YfhO
MLNVKYIIFDEEVNSPDLQLVYSKNKSFVYLNKNVLPRAYFVDTISKKPALEVLNLVKNIQFDPRYIAFTEEDISGVEIPDSTAFVRIEKFDDELIELNVNASGNNFLFLGDTYYSVGWKAFIDGTETKIYRANHGFRGIVVPKGNHKIEFNYLPESFVISKYLALTFSSLVMLGLLVSIFFNFRKSKASGKNGS